MDDVEHNDILIVQNNVVFPLFKFIEGEIETWEIT